MSAVPQLLGWQCRSFASGALSVAFRQWRCADLALKVRREEEMNGELLHQTGKLEGDLVAALHEMSKLSTVMADLTVRCEDAEDQLDELTEVRNENTTAQKNSVRALGLQSSLDGQQEVGDDVVSQALLENTLLWSEKVRNVEELLAETQMRLTFTECENALLSVWRHRDMTMRSEEQETASFVFDNQREPLHSQLLAMLPLQVSTQRDLNQSERTLAETVPWSELAPAWTHALSGSNSQSKASAAAVRTLLEAGIPDPLRATVWPILIGNPQQINLDMYKSCVRRFKDSTVVSSSSAGTEWTAHRDIIVDLPRTFPSLPQFNVRVGDWGSPAENLYSVLSAFAYHRPDISYVQGMSFIAAFLLFRMDPASTFCCLCNVLSAPLMFRMFTMDMVAINSMSSQWTTVFTRNNPSVADNFEELGIEPQLYLFDWILCLYTKSLPPNLCSRVWDGYLTLGPVYLFKVAGGILKLLSPILSRASLEECLYLLSHLPKDLGEKSLAQAAASFKIEEGGAFEKWMRGVKT